MSASCSAQEKHRLCKFVRQSFVPLERYTAAAAEWARNREEITLNALRLAAFTEKHEIRPPWEGKRKALHWRVREVDILLDYPEPAPTYSMQSYCMLDETTRHDLYASHTARHRDSLRALGVRVSDAILPVAPPAVRKLPKALKEVAQDWAAKRQQYTRDYYQFLAFLKRHRELLPPLVTQEVGGHLYRRVREMDQILLYEPPAPLVDDDGARMDTGERLVLYESHKRKSAEPAEGKKQKQKKN